MSKTDIEARELVWVVGEEPAETKAFTVEGGEVVFRPAVEECEPVAVKKSPLEIKINVKVSPELRKAIAELEGKLRPSAETASAIAQSEMSRTFAAACGVMALGATRLGLAAFETARVAREYQARTGRPYPVCGPHRDAWTVTGRYLSVRQGASPFTYNPGS